MKEFKVLFNSGCWEDISTFIVKATSKEDALYLVLLDNPSYCNWLSFVQENKPVLTNNNHGDDNYSTPQHLHI